MKISSQEWTLKARRGKGQSGVHIRIDQVLGISVEGPKQAKISMLGRQTELPATVGRG